MIECVILAFLSFNFLLLPFFFLLQFFSFLPPELSRFIIFFIDLIVFKVQAFHLLISFFLLPFTLKAQSFNSQFLTALYAYFIVLFHPLAPFFNPDNLDIELLIHRCECM
jgi:hypothetical protein